MRTRRGQQGFTLAEMLAAMAIVLLVSAIAAAGMPAAQKAYLSAMNASTSRVLLFDADAELRGLLSAAVPSTIELSPTAPEGYTGFVSFESYKTGRVVEIAKQDSNGKVFVLDAQPGYAGGGDFEATPLCAADEDMAGVLKVTLDGITYADGIFTVSGLRIDGNSGVAPRDFMVRTLVA